MIYIEVTREKIFPLSVAVSLLIVAVGVFILFDAFTGLTVNSSGFIARTRSNAFYWLMYKYPHGTVSAYSATSSPPARSVPVLVYHGESEGSTNTPYSTFVDHMFALKSEGWHTITLKQFQDFMKGTADVPDKSFLLTFDDGRRDTFYPFDPVLKDVGFNAVMFVITGFSLPQDNVAKSFYVNKSELQYMIESGRWELQSHGDMDHLVYHVQSTTDLSEEAKTVDGHFLSNKFWNEAAARFETDDEFAARIEKDMSESKRILEENFGRPAVGFAFPFNDFGQNTINFAGAPALVLKITPRVFTFSFYQHWPSNGDSFNYPDRNAAMIKRIEPKYDWSADDLIKALNTSRAKPLPYKVSAFGSEWVGIWGIVKNGHTLLLKASDSTNGSSVFLDGSGWWQDYEFSAKLDRAARGAVGLIARNYNDTNYLACMFTKRQVILEKHTGEAITVISTAPFSPKSGSLELGIRVRDSSASCSVDGSPVLSGTFSGLSEGGVGLTVWDEGKGVAESEINSMSVIPL